MLKYKIRKKFSRDEKGALEGLPLYLIILVVITAIAIVIIISWLGSIENPKVFKAPSVNPQSITLTDTNGDGYSSTENGTLTITIRDTSDERISGATVTLSGCDVRFSSDGTATMQTNDNGEAAFTGLHIEVEEGTTSSITVKVQKSNYPDKQTTVPVVG